MAIDKGAHVRIATEESFVTADVLHGWKRIAEDHSIEDPGFFAEMGYYVTSKADRAVHAIAKLQELGEGRLRDMDEAGIAMQVLALGSPGVQVFDMDEAVELAASSNDELAEAIQNKPDRYSGIAAIAPQDPARAAAELERAVSKLGLKGAVINSHTHGKYLDDEKHWEIFEAAQTLSVPIYLHPVTPPKAMIGPFLERGLEGAIFGYAVETSLHALRIIISGVLDRFPDLQLVLGHLGEGLPFWLYRLDYMHDASVRANRYEGVKPLERKIADYVRANITISTSGMPWEPAIMFCRSVIGADRVMYSMDYPYEYELAEVEMTDKLPLSAEEMAQFYEHIARRVFSLPA